MKVKPLGQRPATLANLCSCVRPTRHVALVSASSLYPPSLSLALLPSAHNLLTINPFGDLILAFSDYLE